MSNRHERRAADVIARQVPMKARNVKFHAQGEFILVRLVQGESTSPGGVILVDHDKADLRHGIIQSLGDKKHHPKYGPMLEVGQVVMFGAKQGIKIDASRYVISFADVLLASDIGAPEADTEPPPTEGEPHAGEDKGPALIQ